VIHLGEAKEKVRNPDLLWECFVNWVETLEKVEKGKT
jgi:RNAse (barnase) inhibitor barstar